MTYQKEKKPSTKNQIRMVIEALDKKHQEMSEKVKRLMAMAESKEAT